MVCSWKIHSKSESLFMIVILLWKLFISISSDSSLKGYTLQTVQSWLLLKDNFLIECWDEVAVTIQLHLRNSHVRSSPTHHLRRCNELFFPWIPQIYFWLFHQGVELHFAYATPNGYDLPTYSIARNTCRIDKSDFGYSFYFILFF